MPQPNDANDANAPTMTREQAIAAFRALVARYGLQWSPSVPRSAWDTMAEVNKVLTSERDRREALGLPVPPRVQGVQGELWT